MYIEHDINVPWPALLGWAADTPVLEPLGFQRGLYRVETSEQTGLPGLTDQVFRVNITLYNLKLRVTLADEFAPYQVIRQLSKTVRKLLIATCVKSPLHASKKKSQAQLLLRRLARAALLLVSKAWRQTGLKLFF